MRLLDESSLPNKCVDLREVTVLISIHLSLPSLHRGNFLTINSIKFTNILIFV